MIFREYETNIYVRTTKEKIFEYLHREKHACEDKLKLKLFLIKPCCQDQSI